MREEIKTRIEAVRRGEIPEGYVFNNHQIRPIDWQYGKIGKYLTSYDEFSNDTVKYPLATSSRQGLMLQSEYYSDQRYEETSGGFHVVPEGYVTYRHMSDDDIFRFNVNRMGTPVLVSPEYPVFTTTPRLNQELLIAYLNNMKEFTAYCSAQKKGSTRTRMYFSRLGEFEMPIPPLAEQQKIAEILSTCDCVIELKQQLLDEKRKQKQWLMQMLLDPDSGVRLPGFEGSRWIEHKLGDFGYCIRGVSYDPKKDLADSESPRTVTLFRANNIGIDDLIKDDIQFVDSDRVSEMQLVKPGDIAISMSSGSKKAVGKTLYIRKGYKNSCFGAFCAIFRSKHNAFIKHLFESRGYQKALSTILEGTNICNLTNGDIEGLAFWIPEDDAEMRRITSVLSTADKEIYALSKELEAWQKKKKALMQLLLTGLVRVNA